MSSIKYRHLSRDSSHRKALLRNLVSSLIEHETISTTFAKAKEAQREAEKLITLAKKNTNATRLKAEDKLFEPLKHIPKLFGALRERYLHRPGGYTRVLQCEPIKADQAPSAILTLVDGPKDMRFAMTAKAIARERKEGLPMHELTSVNVRKVTRFRKDGEDALRQEVFRLEVERNQAARREKEEFKTQETRYEWLPKPSGRLKGGPGRMRKKPVYKDQYV